MKPQNQHAQEDRLLDFVYGELPPLEARAVESHLEGCARCSELLAGIRGVRTTMSQLPMESAPDAGLESLLAYAQQAARNAAAGPAPKPTWWRRWMLPVAGVAAVTVFGIVSIQVNSALKLKPDLSAQSASKATEESAYPSEPRAPLPMLPSASTPPPAQVAQQALESEGAQAAALAESAPAQPEEAAALAGATPPPPAPAAKLDDGWLAKESPRSKSYSPPAKGAQSDWGNAGAGAGFERSKDAKDEELAALGSTSEKKQRKNYDYDRRDAMTQGPAFPKSKPVLVAPTQGAPATAATPEPAEQPAPAAAQPSSMEETPEAEGLMAESEAQVQQEAPSRASLRITKGKTSAKKPSKAASAADDEGDFDDVFGGGSTPMAKREQRAPTAGSAPPPPPPTASAAPMPSRGTRDSAMPTGRSENRGVSSGPSPSELSKLAEAALRSGNRVREAELLRQALAAGATGKERLGLLNRLCEAEFSIGRRQAAIEACTLVLEEDPRSGAAQVARKRLSREAPEADSNVGPGSRGPLKAAPVDKMEASEPAPVKR